MLRFKQFILEYLTPEEKKQVSTWDKRTPEATKATDHFFGVGNEDHYEPLVNTGDKSEVHRAIERHLGTEISPDEYKSGMLSKGGKQIRIGQAVSDPDLKNGFKTDNTRKNVKANNLSVRTTRSAEGVAGQTSHGQGWKEKSCKNFNTGINRHYLQKEVMHGTVVSYLHDHEGNEIARATFQPHRNAEGNVVYRRDSYYGLKHPEFEKHNREMEFRLSHPHVGSEDYIKHPEVYNDNGVRVAIHPEKAKKLGYEFSNKIKAGTHDDDDIDHAIDHGYLNDEHRHLLGQHLTKKIKAGTHTHSDIEHAGKNGYLNDEHKKSLADELTKKIQAGTHDGFDLAYASINGYLNDEHKKSLADELTKKIQAGTHTDGDIYNARDYGYLTDEHKKPLADELTKKLKDGTYNHRDLDHASNNGYLNDEHKKLLPDALTKKLKDGTYDPDDINNAREYGYLNDEHKKLLPDALTKKIKAGTHDGFDLVDASINGYLNDEHKKLLPDALTKKIKAGTHDEEDISHAEIEGYLNDEHKKLLGY
jgi:polyhydroxyalkanoate synthesis regulator phasin